MEDQNYSQETPSDNTPTTESSPERSQFLTVLCILTFIGSGIGIIQSTLNYFKAGDSAEEAAMAEEIFEDTLDEMEDSGADQSSISFAEALMSDISETLTTQNVKNLSLIKLLANMLTLLGGFLMFRLRKAGFYTYLGGIVIWIAAPLMIIGGILGSVLAGTYAFVGLIFIIMYATNMKQLN